MELWNGEPRFLVKPLPGRPGFLSHTFQATRKGDPKNYILKVGTPNRRAREFSKKIHAFRREAVAYKVLQTLGHKVVPRCYAAAFNPDGSQGFLLLEKITKSHPGDQVAGLTLHELSAAVRSIGAVHAHLWKCHRRLAGKPLPLHQYNRAHETQSHRSAFLREFRTWLSPRDVTMAQKVPGIVSRALCLAKKRPTTLVHGDLRADNLLFSKDRVFIVDWQIAAWGLGTFDLARLMGGSTRRPLSLPKQQNLVKIWHQTLKRGGVRGYTWAEAWQDYRLGVALSLSIPITNGPTLAHLSVRGKKIARLMIHRFFQNGRQFGLL